MKIEFEGSAEEWQQLIGRGMLETIQALHQMQQHHQSPTFTHEGHQGHYQSRSLPTRGQVPCLPPSPTPPAQFVDYSTWLETQTITRTPSYPSQQPTHQSATHPVPQPVLQYQEPTVAPAAYSIPQPFVPSTAAAIVQTTPAEIVPVTQSQSSVKVASWLRSLRANLLHRMLQSKGLTMVLCALVFASSMWGASKLTMTQQTLTIDDLFSEPSTTSSTPSPTPAPQIPTIKASPRPQPESTTKPTAQPASQTVAPVPCLPLPVTEKGC